MECKLSNEHVSQEHRENAIINLHSYSRERQTMAFELPEFPRRTAPHHTRRATSKRRSPVTRLAALSSFPKRTPAPRSTAPPPAGSSRGRARGESGVGAGMWTGVDGGDKIGGGIWWRVPGTSQRHQDVERGS